jgi:GTP pyrophosphokinase
LTLAELTDPRFTSNVLQRYSFNNWDTLCSAVGHGGISESQVINRLHYEYLRAKKTAVDKDEHIIQLINEGRGQTKQSGKGGISVKGDMSMAVRLSHCCNPMPGDEIVGYITRGRGITIHRSDCVNIVNLDEISSKQVTQVEWAVADEEAGECLFNASLDIIARNKPGIVSDISRMYLDEKINMEAINTYRHKDDTLIRVTFLVGSKAQLERLIVKISALNGIYDVKRTIK